MAELTMVSVGSCQKVVELSGKKSDGWCIRLTGDVSNLKLCYEGHSNYTADDGTKNILGEPTEFIF